MSTVKDILCYDGVATGFDANSSAGYSIQVLAGKYLYTFKCSSADAKPVLDSSATVDLSSGGGGGGGGSLTVTVSEGKFDKTWQEVKDAVDGGIVVQVIEEETIGTMTGVIVLYVAHVLSNSEAYIVSIISSSLEDGFAYNTYECSSADGYPEVQY